MNYLILSTLSTNHSAVKYISIPAIAMPNMTASMGHSRPALKLSNSFPPARFAITKATQKPNAYTSAAAIPIGIHKKSGIMTLLPFIRSYSVGSSVYSEARSDTSLHFRGGMRQSFLEHQDPHKAVCSPGALCGCLPSQA